MDMVLLVIVTAVLAVVLVLALTYEFEWIERRNRVAARLAAEREHARRMEEIHARAEVERARLAAVEAERWAAMSPEERWEANRRALIFEEGVAMSVMRPTDFAKVVSPA